MKAGSPRWTAYSPPGNEGLRWQSGYKSTKLMLFFPPHRSKHRTPFSRRQFDVVLYATHTSTYTILRLSTSTTGAVRETKQRSELIEQQQIQRCTETSCSALTYCQQTSTQDTHSRGRGWVGEEVEGVWKRPSEARLTKSCGACCCAKRWW